MPRISSQFSAAISYATHVADTARPDTANSDLTGGDPASSNSAGSETPGLFPRLLLEEVSAYLRQHHAEWQALGVSRVQVFGSVARGEAGEASDVDVLVEFADPAGLLSQVRLMWLFERLLGRRTDVVTAAALKAQLRQAVLEDAVDVFSPVFAVPTDRPSPKRWQWRVGELIAVLERLAHLTAGLDFARFSADQTVQEAAVLNLLRLGEGTKFVPQQIQDAHPEVPWAELRGMRNLIAHDYFGLDLGLIWHSLTRELPPLHRHLRALLEVQPLD